MQKVVYANWSQWTLPIYPIRGEYAIPMKLWTATVEAPTQTLPVWQKSDPAGLVARLEAEALDLLVTRIDSAPLFAHSYAYHLNLRFGTATPFDLLQFASDHYLAGLKIHVEDGEDRSLLNMSKAQRQHFAAAAAERDLKLHVETSSTDRRHLETAAEIARDISAESIRSYPRYEGRVSDILQRTIADLKALAAIDPEGRFRFTLEQHEDLKSHELVRIVQAVGNPRLSLLFDFGNMTNAFEQPPEALQIMAPLVTEVHIKDVKINADRGGWAHLACRSGEGDIDFHGLLLDLLLLGKDEPQVVAFALEEEDGMYAPAYRFPDEGADPFIPGREPSSTELPSGETLDHRLARERNEAARQVSFVRSVLSSLRQAATLELGTRAATIAHKTAGLP